MYVSSVKNMLFLVLCLLPLFFIGTSGCETSSFKNIRGIVSGKNKENATDVILNDCLELNNETKNFFTVEVINQNIEKLGRSSFANLNVITLTLTNNRIREIEKGAFQNLRSVQTLDLSKNRLSRLFKDVLNGLISMKVLDLSYNRIEQIEDQAFAHLVSLRELKLNYNNIKVWNPNWFANNIDMNKLEVEGNLLETLPENSFIDMEQLATLIISNNALREIHQNAFKSITSLRFLDISSNRLIKLHEETFVPFNGITENSGNQNRFSIFNGRPNPFTGLWNLYLHSNNLTYFSEKMMRDLTNSRSLNFFTFHTNPWQCSCYLKILNWAVNNRIRLNSLGKGCYRKDNPVCIVPKEKPNDCVENMQEDIRNEYFQRYKIPVDDFFDRNVVCNSF